MNPIAEAVAAVETALRGVSGLRVYRDPGAGVAADPPAVVLSGPALRWETGCLDPTSATIIGRLVAAADPARAFEVLYDLLPVVVEAVDSTDAAVTRADPGVFPSAGGDLPCYEITIEVPL